MWIYLNDRFVSRAEAVVSVFDHGFLYGDGVYETLRAYQGQIFMLQEHIARLERSAHLIGLPIPLDSGQWSPLLAEVLRRNSLSSAYIRITVSRGEGAIGLDPGLCPSPTLVIVAQPLPSYPPSLYEQGIALIVAATRRNLPEALPTQVKSLNFLNNILAKREASEAKAFDAVMLNADGHLAECTTSNVFFVEGGRVCTPARSCGILDGITRNVVLRLAAEQHIPTEEGTYEPDQLFSAEECFLTNTTMEIMPVRAVDDRTIGTGCPGPMTERLRRLFQASLPRFLEVPWPNVREKS
jgi:branched-chain amino acid aminotransferase